jgi:chemotaxis protein methyltransferase CheR
VALTFPDFDYVRTMVRQKAAITLEDDKVYLVDARLSGLARREGFDSVGTLVTKLRGRVNGLQQKVIEVLTTNETFFFRDFHPFEALRLNLFPEFLQKRSAERCLRVWCGASSTGQEPYSIAMLLREEARFAGWRTEIVATDLSTEVLERARSGSYIQAEINRGLPARLLVKYFHQQGGTWNLKDEVRRMVDFRCVNLIETWPALPPQDIVFLRNVLIYFDVPTKQQILARVRRILRPDGYLFLGGAETTMNLDDNFERVDLKNAGCYRLRAGRCG